jgi:uncharacterized protein (UPF0147 family)
MHTHPAALAHLMNLRTSIAEAGEVDPDVRRAAAELVDRLEKSLRKQSLSKSTVILALDAFKGIPGTSESVAALRVMATED